MRDRIDANGWWEVLGKIAATKRLDSSAEFLEVVYQRLAFQYNGDVWYDVHPLVSESLDRQKSSSAKRKTSRPRKKH